ncbi:hypothetical protein EMCRGX_G016775 [Ephydatia muelleri]
MHAGSIFSFLTQKSVRLGRLVSLGTGKVGQSGDCEDWSVWGLGRPRQKSSLMTLLADETSQPKLTGSVFVFWLLVQYTCVHVRLFPQVVSDPAIGGTYMTLLNTVANIAVAILKTVILWQDVVSFKDCTGD